MPSNLRTGLDIWTEPQLGKKEGGRSGGAEEEGESGREVTSLSLQSENEEQTVSICFPSLAI